MTKFQALRPMLEVKDLAETIGFYRDKLGFELLGTMGDDPAQPNWCHLQRDDVGIMFTWSPPHDHDEGEEHSHDPALGGSLYFTVADVDALHESWKSAVDSFEWAPLTQEYGMRDMGLRDPNGFLLMFGTPVA